MQPVNLGSVITDEGSKTEILCKTAQTTGALTRLKPVWNDRNISLSSKIWLMCSCSLVASIFLNACESWTLTAELQRRIQVVSAFPVGTGESANNDCAITQASFGTVIGRKRKTPQKQWGQGEALTTTVPSHRQVLAQWGQGKALTTTVPSHRQVLAQS